MPIITKTVSGMLRDIKSKEIITEVLVHLSLISSPEQDKQPGIEGTLIIQDFKPEYHDKQYILNINEKVSGRVRITMQPMSGGDMDLITTQYDIWFEDPFWTSGVEWFDSL